VKAAVAAVVDKTAAAKETDGDDVVITKELTPAEAENDRRAPEAPQEALLALIELFETNFLVFEGTRNAADKKRAWEEATKVFNDAAARAGAKYIWKTNQIKSLWQNRRTSFQQWFNKAEDWKSGRDAFWALEDNAKDKPYYYDAMYKLLKERAATAPPVELEVGGGGDVVKREAGAAVAGPPAAAKPRKDKRGRWIDEDTGLECASVMDTLAGDDFDPEKEDDKRAAKKALSPATANGTWAWFADSKEMLMPLKIVLSRTRFPMVVLRKTRASPTEPAQPALTATNLLDASHMPIKFMAGYPLRQRQSI